MEKNDTIKKDAAMRRQYNPRKEIMDRARQLISQYASTEEQQALAELEKARDLVETDWFNDWAYKTRS